MFENIIVGNERSGPEALLCNVNSSTDGADREFVVASVVVVVTFVFSGAWQLDMKLEEK